MQRELQRAIQTKTIQQKTETVGKTSAEALKEGKREGKLEAKRETLGLLLREKFGKKVTGEVVAHIEQTSKVAQLNAWLRKILKANPLDELGVVPEE